MLWAEKWVGTKYTEERDCAWFVHEVMFRETGRPLDIPRMDWRRTTPSEVVNAGSHLAYEVQDPQDYDAVLMEIRGNRRGIGSHLGIYVQGGWILHSTEVLGAVLSRISDLERLQLEVKGYYRWR